MIVTLVLRPTLAMAKNLFMVLAPLNLRELLWPYIAESIKYR